MYNGAVWGAFGCTTGRFGAPAVVQRSGLGRGRLYNGGGLGRLGA